MHRSFMHRTTITVAATLAAVAVAATAGGCKKKAPDNAVIGARPGPTGACPAAPDARYEIRYALGVVPDHRVPSMAEAAKCHADFKANDVVKSRPGPDGKPEMYLAAEGTFVGGCPGEEPHYTYESVKIAKAVVQETALEIPLAKPDPFFLHVHPHDRCGFPLSPGVSPGHNARWSFGPGCDKVVAPQPSTIASVDGANGFNAPADEIALTPLAAGTCTLAIDYLGTKGEVTVTVK